MRDHERRQSGVIDVDDDAALAQALQAREDTFESDRELAKKLQEELNGPARMAPSKRKAAPDTSGDAALARRLAEKDRKGRPGQTPSWVGKAKPKDRSPATPEGWAVDDSGLLDVLADQRKSIRSWLAANASGLHISACDANPHSMPGKPLYNRFVESWQRVPDQTVKLCFHGTAEANIDAICRDGLDPKRRSGQAYGPGEYFGAPGNATISIAYCKGGRKMLVFAVLVDKSGLTCDNGQIIVVNKPEYQLPLFVLTFAAGGAAAYAPAAMMAPPMPAPIPGASPFALNGVASVQAYAAQLAAQRQAHLAQLQAAAPAQFAQAQAQIAQRQAQAQARLAQQQAQAQARFAQQQARAQARIAQAQARAQQQIARAQARAQAQQARAQAQLARAQARAARGGSRCRRR